MAAPCIEPDFHACLIFVTVPAIHGTEHEAVDLLTVQMLAGEGAYSTRPVLPGGRCPLQPGRQSRREPISRAFFIWASDRSGELMVAARLDTHATAVAQIENPHRRHLETLKAS